MVVMQQTIVGSGYPIQILHHFIENPPVAESRPDIFLKRNVNFPNN